MIRSFFLPLMSLFLVACASGPGLRSSMSESESSARVQNELSFIPQEKNMCGPTVLKMLSQQRRPEVTLQDIRAMSFHEKEQGTFKSDFLSAARRLGFAPYQVRTLDEVFERSKDGDFVVVFQNLGLPWWPTWHYAIVTGYDSNRDLIFLHSGTSPHLPMKTRAFQRTWDWGGSWAYVLKESSEIPLWSRFEEALENAIVFDELKMSSEALGLYETMKFIWPDRFEPYLGTANNQFLEGEIDQSINDLGEAIARNPLEPALYFNMSMIYHLVGNRPQALHWKQEALALLPVDDRIEYSKRFGF